MKYLILIPFVVVSCASHPKVDVHPLPENTVSSDPLRYGEVVRPYQVGRCVDPNHPQMMEEAHSVYRVEVSAHWNLHPGADGQAAMSNQGRDAAYFAPLTNDMLVAEMNRQREATALVMREALRLSKSCDDLQKAFDEMKNIAHDNAALASRLSGEELRVTDLEQQLRRLNGESSLSTNEPNPPKP
jgi:hypothetical protein